MCLYLGRRRKNIQDTDFIRQGGLGTGLYLSGLALSKKAYRINKKDGQNGRCKTVIAEVQAHMMALTGVASVRFGVSEGEPGGIGALAELTYLMVLPRYHRNGVATKLLDVIEKDANLRGDGLVVKVDPCKDQEAVKALLADGGYLPVDPTGPEVHIERILKAVSFPGGCWAKQVKNRV